MCLALPSDFDVEWATGFLAARAVPALERVLPGVYQRSVHIRGRLVTLSCRFHGRSLSADSAPALPAEELRRHVSRLFDLATDLGPFRALTRRDPLLRRVTTGRPTARVLQFLDPFEGLVRAILGQQVSLGAARTMAERHGRIRDLGTLELSNTIGLLSLIVLLGVLPAILMDSINFSVISLLSRGGG